MLHLVFSTTLFQGQLKRHVPLAHLQIFWILQDLADVEGTFADARLVCHAKLRCPLQRTSGMIYLASLSQPASKRAATEKTQAGNNRLFLFVLLRSAGYWIGKYTQTSYVLPNTRQPHP